MTIAMQPNEPVVSPAPTTDRLPGMATAAVASIGAGVIHAGAIGIHAEHAGLARMFVAVAVFQIGWGMIALFKPSRWFAVVGAIGNAVAVAGWLATRVSGISFIEGLETREAAQFADTACAVLGLVAVGLALAAALVGLRNASIGRLTFPSLIVAAIAIPAMISGSAHVHSHSVVAADGTVVNEALPHNHGAATDTATAGGATDNTAHTHVAAAVPTVKYDPSKPIDLGGVEGVTPEQQAAAENLVAFTVVRLPQWSDFHTAEAAGFHSIGDAATGVEHYIQWSWINDDVTLNPDKPESLVYEPQPDGTKKLVSAMYLLPNSVKLADVPELGGKLTQFHIHNNLCFTKDPVAPRVAGLTDAAGNCPAALQKFPEAPMIHVWITPQDCGPFSALEGIGAGQVAEGQTKLCDHAHGQGF
ncbi:MAG: hypothetical protein F2735_06150 [Actinobacteria bacterium]|uniref:Unannotated protein n=1 Tax=freshwater metagenome TaxID=449393 RepID=A0A6J6Y700_9ZZZZ|nr:hypothetical protein [Actinomycetota bacterium]